MGYAKNVEVIYDYIVTGLAQANVAEKHEYKPSEVSQLIREYGFNRQIRDAYASGEHKGKFKNGYKGMAVTRSHIAQYMGSGFESFEDFLEDIAEMPYERKVHQSAAKTQNTTTSLSSIKDFQNPSVNKGSSHTSSRVDPSGENSLMAIGIVIFVIYLIFNFVLKPGYIAVKDLIGDTGYAVTLKAQKDIDFKTTLYKDNQFAGTTSFGKPKGFGKMVSPYGDISLGSFNRGRLLGPGVHLSQSENFIFGNFKKDKLEDLAGEWNNGVLQIGEYHKGVKDGIVAVIGSDGVIQVGEYKDDVLTSEIALINRITKQVDLITSNSKFVSFEDGENVGIAQVNAIAYNGITVKTDGENIAMGYIKWKKPRGYVMMINSERIIFGTMDKSKLKDAVSISFNKPVYTVDDMDWKAAFKTISIGNISDKGLDGLIEQYDPAQDDLQIGYWNDGIANGKFVHYSASGEITFMNYREGYPLE